MTIDGDDEFGTAAAADGYASARPAVHPLVIDQIRTRLDLGPVERTLDVGCGAGLSTRPLLPLTRWCGAVDPAPGMVARARAVVPGASVLVGRAEALPVASGSIGLVTAAGSLDYADLSRAVPELCRVLAPGGLVVAYDFGTGCRRRHGELGPWFEELFDRWPRPLGRTTPPTEDAFAAGGLAGAERWPFEVVVSMDRGAFLRYLLTESFVAAALGRGHQRAAISAWMEATVPWPSGEVDDVVFEGYVLAARP